MVIQLPDGGRFNPDGFIWYLSGYTITFTLVSNGATFTYAAPNESPTLAAFVLYQIDLFIAQGANSLLPVPTSGYVITSISPTSFDITTATLTINGTGFTAANIGKIFFEDAIGGADSNGYYAVCTYVSPTEMTTVYGGSGDTTLSKQMIIYYEDSNGLQSNLISATNPSGTLITIP